MKKIALLGFSLMAAFSALAGGLLTNTNQNVAFNRMMSREASIGIDGVYSNPAGCAFMKEGAHLSLNWQLAIQTRTIENEYPLFAYNTNNSSTQRKFEGKAFAPVIPSIQFVYNKNDWSFQGNFSLCGGGGKCTFDNGLGSFERMVANTAVGVQKLAAGIDQASQQLSAFGVANPNLSKYFPNSSYSYESYMRGRQYYFGLSVGVARKFNENFAGYVGVRGVYATCNYYGYVKNIKVGNVPLYMMLDKTKTGSADIELNCDQNGYGVTPILGIDFKTGRWNFSAKYEFKTRLRLHNKAVNQAPSIGNLSSVLLTDYNVQILNPKLSENVPDAYKATVVGVQQQISSSMKALGAAFDASLEEATGEYADGASIPGDIPALLTLGAGYKPVDALRVNVGFHYFFDKQAKKYNNAQEKLKRGTIEFNAGAEYDINKMVTVSAGWQNTNYGITDEYMNDQAFVTNSNSIGVGACIHASKKVDVNVAYFTTLYGHKKTTETDANTGLEYKSDYTRTNNVFGIGVDFHF